MTSTDFLKRLCEGYVRSYRGLGLRGNARNDRTLDRRTDSRGADVTHRELNFFAKLGEMLGFVARLEAERRDLSWFDADSGELVLHMERETTSKKARNTMTKLLQTGKSEACYLAAVLGWVTEEDFASVRRAIASHLGGRSLVVLAWVGPNIYDATSLEVIVASEGNVYTRRGKAEPDKDKYWYARYLGGWRNAPGYLRGRPRSPQTDGGK